MQCYVHPDKVAEATCADCGAGVCADCLRDSGSTLYCAADYAIARYDPREAAAANVDLGGAVEDRKIGEAMPSPPPPALVDAEALPAPTPLANHYNPVMQPKGRIDRVISQMLIGLVALMGIVIYVNYRVGLTSPSTDDICGGSFLVLISAIAIFCSNVVASRRWRESHHPTVALVLGRLSTAAIVLIGLWGVITLINYYSVHTACPFGFC